MVVYGENARGKSSFVDAIECYFLDRIGHLERESVGRAAYRHRAHPKDLAAWVRLEFSERDKGGTLEIDATRRLTYCGDSPEAEAFKNLANRELLILRHRDLSRFVDMTKREKLSDLAPLLGTEVLDETRGELSAALRQVEGDLDFQQQRIRERQESIAARIGRPDYSDADMWGFVNQEAAVLGAPEPIGQPKEMKVFLEKVSITPDPQRGQRLRALEDAKRELEELGRLPNVVGTAREFANAFNQLALDQQAIQEIALAGVREAGLGVLRSEWWTQNVCPLCDEPLRDRPSLVSMLEARLLDAAEVRQRARELEAQRESARNTLRQSGDALEQALAAVGEVAECAPVNREGGQVLGALRRLNEALRTPLEPGARVAESEIGFAEQQLESLHSARSTSGDALSAAIARMQPGEEERRRLNSYTALSGIAEDMERLEGLGSEYSASDARVRSLRNALEEFERREREAVSAVVEQLSDDVTRYYQKLYGGERYSNVRLEFLPEERGLEFSLEAYGEDISPPRLILSESQLNGLGLCLFLAAAKHFNTDAGFVVLDDVVNSFDADHRTQLAELLVEEFEDFQVIAFTHDPVWFDILRQMAPAWEFQRIVGWSYEQGVQLELPPREERERIERHIDKGEADVAGNLAGDYIENRLKYVCLRLRVPLPYRSWYDNEKRGIGELLRFLVHHVQSQKHFQLRDPHIWNKLNASGLIRNLTSHDQPELPAPPSGADVAYALEKVEGLMQQFSCQKCGKWVWYARLTSDEFEFQCHCGQMQFR